MCSPLDETVATTLEQATKFLHEGPNPLQVGVDAGVLDPRRVAVLHGKITHDGAPVAGATVSIVGHPAFGKTLSRCDGAFDLVINGGGALTVRLEGAGYLPVRRRVEPRWQTYTVLPEVVLTTADAPIAIDLAAGGAAQASLVTDKDGARRATLLFPPGTVATVNGTPLGPALHVRATEYTVGADGPKKMPATLPASSGYTYAVEYSFDEAVEGQSVSFDRPVPAYVNNFLKLPVGTRVPAGFYDKEQEAWLPSDDGRVIKIVGVRSGLADVDSDGDEIADDNLEMSEKEREQLASLYQNGQTLWRVAVFHFSSWDFNWPFGPPSDAIAALKALEDLLHTDDADGACKTSGSIKWLPKAPLPRLLDDLHLLYGRDDPTLVTVELAETGDSLTIGLGRDLSVLNYVRANKAPPYFTSTGGADTDQALAFRFGGEWSEFPMSNGVPILLAREVVRHFCETGQLTKDIEWEEV